MASYGDLQFATRKNQKVIRGVQWPVKQENTGGMFSCAYNQEAVKDGLVQLILTQKGERPMRPGYGTNLRAAPFEPMDGITIGALEKSILTAIEKYEPRVTIIDFKLIPNEETSELDLSLVFSLKNNVLTTESIFLTVGATKNILIK